MIPVPHDTRNVFKNHRDKCDNAFLLLNRYLEIEGFERQAIDTKNTRDDLYDQLKQVTFETEPHFQRVKSTVNRLKQSGGYVDIFELKTNSRLVVGLGDSNALEVGMTLHPLYGFPYIPGSSLKGLCRSWLEIAEDTFNGEKLEEGNKLNDTIRRESHKVFGSLIKDENSHIKKQYSESKADSHLLENRLGDVTFFDAIPVDQPEFEVDIMNPHYSKYYSDPGNNPPGDWYSPIPIKFLTVKPGVTFLFALISDEEETLQKAKQWLVNGLTELGVGAKTSSGYGYFTEPGDHKTEGNLSGEEFDEEERPDWALEMDANESETETEQSTEEKIIDLLQGDPKKNMHTAYAIWEQIEDEEEKKRLAQFFFQGKENNKYIKKKQKPWVEELKKYKP